MVRKIEAEFDITTGTAIEANFEVLACIPVSEAEHNDLSGRDEDDAHPISAITDLQDTLDGLETDIESEATTRASADTTLQTNINTEASTRQAADTTLTNNLNTEIATRENEDTVLSTAISTEATTRGQADTALGTRIDNEEDAREQADTALGTRIDNLALNSLTDVTTSGMTNGQALVYDTTSQKWINGTVALNQGTGISISNNTISVADPTLVNNGTGLKSVAVGTMAEATQEGTTSVGYDADAKSTFGTAIGYASRATNTNTIAIGKQAKAQQARSIAIGVEATTNATDTIQLGAGTNATENTFQVKTYTLLDTSTGKIPVDRLPDITLSKVSDVTASASEVNVLDGITATTQELNYTDGVTSNIQTQLNGKQATISDIGTIRSNAQAGKNASDTIATYGDIVTHDVDEFATSEQGELADSALQPSDVINDVQHTTTDMPLSANMGKELSDRLDNVEARGRYLSQWNCSTGLPATNPTTSPYSYQRGDYYIVGTVASGSGTNYRPNGSSYTTGVASTTVESQAVAVNDTYIYDGTTWILQSNTQKEVSFANLAGQPTDNSNLAAALNEKQDSIDSSNKLSSDLVDDTNYTNKFVTAGQITTWTNKQDAISDLATIRSGASAGATALQPNTAITAGTATKVTYDTNGLITAGTTLSASDIPSIPLSNISDVTATYSEVNVLDGITATTTELNYCDGVTSNIQTQLDAKADEADLGTLAYADAITNGDISGTINQDKITNLATTLAGKQDNLPTLVSGQFLTNNGTTLSWSAVDALPSQSGQSGKFLTTNGTTASWSNVNALVIKEW